MQTKTAYEYLGNNVIIAGVYDWLFKEDSGILGILPRKTVRDNGVKYNVETTYPVATWTDVGDVIPESAGTFEQRSAALYNLIHDIDVDKSQIAKDATQNKEAVEIMRQMRGFLNTWQDTLIHGQTTTSTSTKQCKGLMKLLAEIEAEGKTDLDGATTPTGNNTQFVVMNATSGALTLDGMDMLLDCVKLGADALIMTRMARRYLNTLCRAAGIYIPQETDTWQHKIGVYNGAKIYINDHLKDNMSDASSSVVDISAYAKATTRAGGADNTLIFALNFSEDGVHIIQTGDIEKEPRVTCQNKDAWRHRVKWYTGVACYNKWALAALHCIPASAGL